MQDSQATTRYYATFLGYEIPFRPAQELERDAIALRETYYVAHYVGKALVRFEKIAEGARVWLDEYIYWPNGGALQHRKMTKEDGTVVEQDFDRRGRVMRE
jgi:Family of unknown function (DUF6156)